MRTKFVSYMILNCHLVKTQLLPVYGELISFFNALHGKYTH
jgi:hypothetical protein